VKRTYLITASTGIGAETARMLAKAGHNIFVVSRTEANCAEFAAELRSLGAQADHLAGDVADPQTAPRAVAACVKRFGRIDGLFNVAGISGRKFGDGPVHEYTEDGWATVMTTNATSQYRMCREAVRVMLKQEPLENGQRGVILNMASILGLHPEPTTFGTHAYAASKGAIIALSRSMAASYALDKIRVNVVAPGLVRTPMSARASKDEAIVAFMKRKQPLVEDVIAVEDAAAPCHFLLTDASRAITGEVLEVDAGWNLV